MRDANSGFTLIELLVVIAVIGILAAMLLSALTAVKARALRIECMNNVRQCGLIFIEYAHDNNSRLPSQLEWNGMSEFTTGLSNSDVNYLWTQTFRRYGLSKVVASCPANPHPIDFAGTSFTGTSYRAPSPEPGMYYVTTLSVQGGDFSTNWNESIDPQMIYLTPPGPAQKAVGFQIIPSKRVLLADWSMSGIGESDPARITSYNWTTARRFADMFPNEPDFVLERTDHVDSHGIVTGSNDGMLDGHVEWVKARNLRVGYPGGPDIGWDGPLWW